MTLGIYVLMVTALIVLSQICGKTEKPVHAVYVNPIYPAVLVFMSLIIKSRRRTYSAESMILYGKRREATGVNFIRAVNLSSLILFLFIPVLVYTLMDPGGFELFVSYCLAATGFFIPNMILKQKAERERTEILRDFPAFCMDLAVLTGAGLVLEKAWKRAIKNKPSTSFYCEARLVLVRNEAGIPMEESIVIFARRLGVPEIYSFSAVISQTAGNGRKNTSEMIRKFAMQSWEKRNRHARERGEKASVKMVFPLALGLAGVIVIVAFPAFAAMKGLI